MSAHICAAATDTKTTMDPTKLDSSNDPILATANADLRSPAPTSQVQLALGYVGGNLLENDEWAQGPLVSIRYAPIDIHENVKWDFGGEINKDNIFGLFVGRRWYVEEDEFRPYARVAAGSFFDSHDQLGNLVEIKRWRARASLGIGDRLNFEAGLGIAVTGPDFFAQLGYNFNF
ncbi:hypothetical protein [Bdellovibrio sp. NC01]|uniref:hypothetical protein n=1 Tax=Bdellovibrio sp. NC01 TaxID=2220073 RepID=UPI00115C3603|nr:hypothetical protein [Bdellovibrio sp. NC01]